MDVGVRQRARTRNNRRLLGKPKINSPPSNYEGRGPSWDGFDVDLQKIIGDCCLDSFARAEPASGLN